MKARTLLLLAATTACSGAADSASSTFTVRDSAGIRIADNPREAPALTLVEELRIGEVEGPEHLQFFRIGPVLVAGDDRLQVANVGSSEVREFTTSGEYLGSFGSAGDGPGEYRFIARLVQCADTTVVLDGEHMRATWVGPDRGTLRSSPLMAGSVAIYPLACSADGWVVEASDFGGDWPYEVGRPYSRLTRLALLDDLPVEATSTSTDADSLPWRVVLEYAGQPFYGINSTGVMTANPPLWEPEPEHAADASGAIYLSRGTPYEIRVFSPRGELVRILRREHEPVPVTDALRDRYFSAVRTYYDTTTQRGHEFEIGRDATLGRADLPRNESLPPLGRLLVSRDGAVWVERPDLVEDPVKLEWTRLGRQDTFWDVFRPTGELLGTVRLSSRFTPRTITGAAVYGVERDSLDVEQLVRYRIAEW